VKRIKRKARRNKFLRNNDMAAVILSTDEYELLRQAKDIFEHLEIADRRPF
jgi:PHD/YefM family antitoxin component YafN of YafNO toxin-antitoxin module